MSATTTKTWVSPGRAAEILNCDSSYVRRLRRDGRIRSKLLGRDNYLLLSDLNLYLKEKESRKGYQRR